MQRKTRRNGRSGWDCATTTLLLAAGCLACGVDGDARELPPFVAVQVEGTLDVQFSPYASTPLLVRCDGLSDPTGNLLAGIPDATELVQSSVDDGVLTLRAPRPPVEHGDVRTQGGVVPGSPRCSVELQDPQGLRFIRIHGDGDVVGGKAAELTVDGKGNVRGATLLGRWGTTVRVNHLGSGTVEFLAPATTASVHLVNRGGGTVRVAPSAIGFVGPMIVEQHGPGRVEVMVAQVLDGVRVHATGSGTVWLQGMSPLVEVHMEGTGKVNAGALTTRRAEVWADGSGLLRVMATEAARVSTHGPVDVEVLGSPPDVVRESRGPLGARTPDGPH